MWLHVINFSPASNPLVSGLRAGKWVSAPGRIRNCAHGWVISAQGKVFALQVAADLVDHVVSAESVFMVT
jgi:hypothetical protein